MIISHRHRFIFIAVPKVASRALRQALTMKLDAMDWQQQNLFAERRLPIETLASKSHGHLSVRELRPHLPGEIWESYLKFAFVRNPFERFVDTCLFLDGGAATPRDATARMKQAITTKRFRQRPLAWPQSDFLVDDDGRVAVDFVGRYETLQSSFDEVCRLIGLGDTALERRRKPEDKPWMRYYDAELRDLVAAFYRDDIANFAYGYGEPEAAGA